MNATVNCTTHRRQAHVQGTVRIVIDGFGRIIVPNQLRRSAPCLLVEVSPEVGSTVGQWLAIIDSADGQTAPAAEFAPHLQVVAKSIGYEFVFPASVSEKYGLKSGCPIWLVAVGDYLEVWSDSAYQAQERLAVDLVLSDALTSPIWGK